MEQLHLIYTNIKRSQAYIWGFPCSAVVKNLSANAGDTRDVGSNPGLGRPPGVGALHSSVLVWKKSRTRLSAEHAHMHIICWGMHVPPLERIQQEINNSYFQKEELRIEGRSF